MVLLRLSKPRTGVRFPSPAPNVKSRFIGAIAPRFLQLASHFLPRDPLSSSRLFIFWFSPLENYPHVYQKTYARADQIIHKFPVFLFLS